MATPSGADLPRFAGFPAGTFTFLRGVKQYNEKIWFNAHRASYEEFYLRPGLQLVHALGPRLRKISRAVVVDDRPKGGSMLPIFLGPEEKKRFYKTFLDLWFWEGERDVEETGFYLKMNATRIALYAGLQKFGKRDLETYRAAVLDDAKGEALLEAMAEVRRASKKYQVMGYQEHIRHLKGYDKKHPRVDLLRYLQLYAGFEMAVPKVVRSAELVDWCGEHFAALYPLSRWIRANVTARGKERAK